MFARGDVVFGVAFLVGLLSLGAMVFRTEVLLYNKLAGGAESPRSVLVPGFFKAMAITLVSSFNAAVVAFLVGLGIVVGATAAGAGGRGVELVALMIAVFVGLTLQAATIAAMLPATFVRAVLLTLFCLPLNGIVIGVAEVIAFFVSGKFVPLW